MRQVPVEGGYLAVEDDGNGPPLLFVHGWTLDRRAWHPQVAAFRERFRTISFDRRGAGRSTAPPALAREPDDLAVLLDAHGIERATIIAMSQGVRVALAFAASRPERVDALVLQGAPALIGDASDESSPAPALAALARDGDWERLRRIWRDHPLLALHGDGGRGLLDAMIADYRGRDLLAPAMPLDVSAAALAAIRQPTLILCGRDEVPSRRAAAAELAGTMPDARHVVVPGGHLCNLCSPLTYNAVVAEFLGDHLLAARASRWPIAF